MSSSDMSSAETSSLDTPSEKPPILASAKLAWTEGLAALAQMPNLMLVALFAATARAGLEHQLALWIGVPENAVAFLVISALLGIAWTFLVTPVYLAVHRRILLGETTQHYRLASETPPFRRFFGCAVGLYVLMAAPGLLTHLLGQSGAVEALTTALLLVAIVVMVRTTLLFPAIAVDAPGANLANAFADSAGHFWRILAILLVTSLPWAAVGALMVVMLGAASTVARYAAAIVSVVALAVLIAVASRLYQRLGKRLNMADPSVGPAQLTRG